MMINDYLQKKAHLLIRKIFWVTLYILHVFKYISVDHHFNLINLKTYYTVYFAFRFLNKTGEKV